MFRNRVRKEEKNHCMVQTISGCITGGMSRKLRLEKYDVAVNLLESAGKGEERVKKKNISYEKLYTELEGLEKNGICIFIDGFDASPMQVVKAHMAREAGSYMRDYELGAKGQIESLSFVNINSSICYDQKIRENQLQPLLSD